jgi:23S rRNA (cytosine1962-C5)-methyltransferase
LREGRLWFFPSDIHTPDLQAAPESLQGASVLWLQEPRGKTLATALYDAASPVPIRVLEAKRCTLDADLLLRKLQKAIAWRRQVIPATDSACRLVHSEADGLPGLTVDRFGEHIALQFSMAHWLDWEPWLLAQIQATYAVSSATREFQNQREWILGEASGKTPYVLNGLTYFADPLHGQKTGAFLDQRDNYVAVENWARRLALGPFGLDLFTANGGFARHLARSMEKVDAVDSSSAAIASLASSLPAAERERVHPVTADAITFLKSKASQRHQYQAIVVDPPAFAKTKSSKPGALRKYFDLNRRAMQLVSPGGLFVTCSCSYHISRQELFQLAGEAAQANEKTLQVLEQRGQSLDHPEIVHHPESSYLQCLIYRVT